MYTRDKEGRLVVQVVGEMVAEGCVPRVSVERLCCVHSARHQATGLAFCM